MYSECAFELFFNFSATRYFPATGKCERTHHTLALGVISENSNVIWTKNI
ncbi:hypothetical protein SAMN04488029_3186 [Reichenbachiella faecimaris]|uniref:Uncharacterized protein n=1 Tax=Reichenbachiella faecimaris TaxID=692418 RepID=A0A1W2GKC3_REIFA|nr:hypothetical protein SAMN04488029_3186 [Reichenbachiella faecimaris]